MPLGTTGLMTRFVSLGKRLVTGGKHDFLKASVNTVRIVKTERTVRDLERVAGEGLDLGYGLCNVPTVALAPRPRSITNRLASLSPTRAWRPANLPVRGGSSSSDGFA